MSVYPLELEADPMQDMAAGESVACLNDLLQRGEATLRIDERGVA